jgi:hypothetical protein
LKPTCVPKWAKVKLLPPKTPENDGWLNRLRSGLLITCLAALVLVCSACVTLHDPEVSQEYRVDTVAVLAPGQEIGQTFISRRSSLNGLTLWLHPQPDSSPDGLSLEIYHSTLDQTPLVSLTFAYEEIANNNQISASFAPLNDPPDESYYLLLKSDGGAFQLLGRNDDAYPYGELYINGASQEADLSFQTSYDYGLSNAALDLQSALLGLWLVIPLVFTVWLPGRVLLNLAGKDCDLDWGERTAASVGLSLALIPILMTWTSALGLRWTQVAVWIAGGILALLYLWRLPPLRFSSALSSARIQKIKANPEQFALVGVFVFSLAVRLVMARDLAAPPWVDSVHHGMIARLIIEQGAFPKSYAPFLDIETASYHAGFHSVLAVFHWFSGLGIADAMLLLGQVLNGLAVLAVYLFTKAFTRSRAAGVAAAMICGLLTPMPAYYTSWGRYTQLASLLILPVAMALLTDILESVGRLHWASLALAAIACGGLFLTHYRVVAFLGCLLIAYLVAQVLQVLWKRSFQEKIPALLGRLTLVTLFSIGLTIPWWPATLETLLIPKLGLGSGGVPLFSDFSWGYLTSASGLYTLVLAGLGVIWGLIRRKWLPFILVFWTAFMFLIANLGVLHLPGAGFVNNTSVEITLFIPVAALGGYLIASLVSLWENLLPPRWRGLYAGLVAIAAVTLALYGARTLLPILNPITMLFREADRPAMAWIQENIPEDATILINPFAWGYGLYAGNDGGYWIVPLAGRKTLPPPVLYGLGNNRAEVQKISAASQHVTEISADPVELHSFLLEQKIDFIYIGARGGALSPGLLRGSPLFQVLYNYADTWVFQVLPETSRTQ